MCLCAEALFVVWYGVIAYPVCTRMYPPETAALDSPDRRMRRLATQASIDPSSSKHCLFGIGSAV